MHRLILGRYFLFAFVYSPNIYYFSVLPTPPFPNDLENPLAKVSHIAMIGLSKATIHLRFASRPNIVELNGT
jgi:hypothetical protein